MVQTKSIYSLTNGVAITSLFRCFFKQTIAQNFLYHQQ